jgi:hypothetical protein
MKGKKRRRLTGPEKLETIAAAKKVITMVVLENLMRKRTAINRFVSKKILLLTGGIRNEPAESCDYRRQRL